MRSPTVIAACAAFVATAVAPATAGQGNVLVVVADDLGVDNVGAYGEGTDPPSTPHIDALAADGVLFRNAWGQPLCAPSRAAMQTGRHPFRVGIGAHPVPGGHALVDEELTVAEALDFVGLGHETAFFGKWHLSNDAHGGALGPNLAGYDHFAGVRANLGIDPAGYYQWEKIVNGATFTQQGYVTTDTVDDALAWIGSRMGPWMAFVAFNAPHAPYHAPPSHLHTVDLSNAGPPKQDRRIHYEAMVEAMDTEIGRLLDGVASGGMERTTVIFLGDNGTPDDVTVPPFVPQHAKGTAYEGGVNVPLIASGAHVTARAECHALVGMTDLFATILDLASRRPPRRSGPEPTEPPPPMRSPPLFGPHASLPADTLYLPEAQDSVSFAPLLADPDGEHDREHAWAEIFFPNAPARPTAWRQAVRGERYKVIVNQGVLDPPLPTGTFFYDLVLDPFETTNLLEAGMTAEQQAAYDELVAEALSILGS